MSSMEIRMENGRADARFGEFVVSAGGGEAPSAFNLFLASLGTCTALTAAAYCKTRRLSSDGMKVLLDVERDPDTDMAKSIKMKIVPPEGFPESRHSALIKAAEKCFVKRHLYEPPQIETSIAE